MTPPLAKTSKSIRYVGARPKDDQDNPYREKLCQCVKGTGCFYEISPGKFYMVYMAKGEKINDLLMSSQDDPTCPFIFWTTLDFPTLVYQPFDSDFGPFNLAVTHHFCSRVKIWIDTQAYRSPDKVPVIVLDDNNTEKKLNMTLLVAIAAMVIFKLTDEEVLQRLNFFMLYRGKLEGCVKQLTFREKKKFSDVSGAHSLMTLTLDDCIKAFYAALQFKFYDYYEFDHAEYLFYETVMSGDLNWIVPGKLLAFAGPCDTKDWNKHPPSFYYHYFKDHNVSSIIRLNEPEYLADDFRQMGFEHHDLIFPDGLPPTSTIAAKFIKIVDEAKGAVAVHCYAGIGRTGTLIAAYLMARYDFTPQMAVAWTRICRPGSVIGEQQDWLYTKFDNYSFSKGPKQTLKSFRNRKIKEPDSPTEMITSDDIKTCPPTPVTRQQAKTSFAEAEKTLGQAKALQLAKRQREATERPCTRSHPVAVQRSSIDGNTSSQGNKDSSTVRATSNKQDVVLNLGKTIPITMQFSDVDTLKGEQNPEYYNFKDGRYEFRINFPTPGYVELRHSYEKDLLLLKLRALEADVASEMTLEFNYEESEEDKDLFQTSAKEATGSIDVNRIPRLKPVAYYSLSQLI